MFNIRNLVSRISQAKDGESGDNSQSRSSPGKGRSSQGNTSATEEVAVEAEGFLCPTCMAAFPSAEDLQIHYERMHLEPGANYLCPMCKARLESSTALEVHFAANHATSVVCSKNVDDLNQELSQLTQTLNAERWVSEELRKEINQFREMSRSYGTSEESKMFQMQLDGLHETKSLLSSEVVLLRKQLAEALDSMVLLRQERDHLQEKAAGYSQALVKLQAELDEKFGDRTYFQDRISLSESKPIDNSDDANILKEELSSMHTIMDQKTADWKAERTRLEQNLEDMESRHEQLAREYEVLKDSFDSEQQSLSNLQRIRDETDICVSQLRQEVTSLQEMLNQARDRAEGEVSAKEDELLKAKMQLLTNQQQVSQLEDKCESLEKSAIAAQMEVLTKDKLFQDQARLEADRYEKQRAKLEEMIQRLEREKIHLATKSEQGEGYQGLVDQLQEDNERLASELRNSQKALQDNEDLLLQKEAEISSIQLAVASGKDKLQQMESRANTADQQLEQSRLVYDELEVKYTQLQQQISILQKNCAVTEEQCRNKDRELSQANEDHKLQTERLIKESVDLQDTICQLEQKVALMRGHCTDLENQCSSASQQVIETENNHRLDIERLGQDISDLRSQNASFACQVEELLQHSESLRKENQSVCDRDQITSNELRTVRENLDRERQVTQQLQDSMSVLERLICTQKADKQDLEKEKSLLMENIQLLRGEKDSLSTLASHMKQQLDECREEHRIHLQRINTEMDSLNKEKQFMVDAICKEKDERKTDMMVSENAQAKLNEQLKVSNNNMTKVREELETQYIRCQEFQLQIDKYHAEQLERDASLSLLNDEKQQLQQHCSQWQNEVERLKMSSAELRRRLEDSQAALHELGRENQSLQMENAKLHGRKWADDSEVYDCHGCQREFTLTVRKHHCRNCGQIFCGDCSNKNASLGSNRKAVRVCEACFKELCSPR